MDSRTHQSQAEEQFSEDSLRLEILFPTMEDDYLSQLCSPDITLNEDDILNLALSIRRAHKTLEVMPFLNAAISAMLSADAKRLAKYQQDQSYIQAAIMRMEQHIAARYKKLIENQVSFKKSSNENSDALLANNDVIAMEKAPTRYNYLNNTKLSLKFDDINLRQLKEEWHRLVTSGSQEDVDKFINELCLFVTFEVSTFKIEDKASQNTFKKICLEFKSEVDEQFNRYNDKVELGRNLCDQIAKLEAMRRRYEHLKKISHAIQETLLDISIEQRFANKL